MKSATELAKNVTKWPTSSGVPKRPTKLGSISCVTFFSIVMCVDRNNLYNEISLAANQLVFSAFSDRFR